MRLRLDELDADLTTAELLNEMVPPAEFRSVSFDNYIPDANHQSQANAVAKCSGFVQETNSKQKQSLGIYLDGGFGVGKTHLLASIYHASKRRKLFGSFVAFTSTIGYLGFAEAVKQFSKYGLICIDEFELDDPGDTMIMSRFLKELAEKGVCFAATSNTPPNALGEGRFAADSFQREIQSVAGRFQILRIDGEDYRHRGNTFDFEPAGDSDIAAVESNPDRRVIKEDLDSLLRFLGSLHQSRYARLAEQFDTLIITNTHTINDQYEGVRFVSFIDRCYEAGISLKFNGQDLAEIFRSDHLLGAYQKKYRRCLSRLAAMANR